MADPRMAVGIDLGTTNSLLAYVDLTLVADGETPEVQFLAIPQVVSPGQTESLESLPSFVYLTNEQEREAGGLEISVGRPEAVIGSYARQVSAEQPERTVAAAKSWLCHGRVDRQAAILPWQAPERVSKISPVTASRWYLEYLIAAWDQQFPDAPLRDQQVVLTVPASFDVAARELTRQAAKLAGLPDSLILLEEPQAAVYQWLSGAGENWRRQVREGDRILVCDVGGGTTDLSLVQVDQIDGQLELRRMAVGNHLLVGGDNMDLALAHFAASKFAEAGTRLNAWQSVALWHSCRKAKESLLSNLEGVAEQTLSVLGRGSKLIGGAVSLQLSATDVERVLLEGFFPVCSLSDRPQRQASSGFQQLGLPFETETAITRHLADFLCSAPSEVGGSVVADDTADDSSASRTPLPNRLLLNGGVFKSASLRRRLVECIASWSADGAGPPQLLEGQPDLDRAVAGGAAYYAWSKLRGGVRIRGGAPRSYYVGIETAGLAVPGMPRPLQAMCVVPQGLEEGSTLDIPSREVGLVVGQPARFRFFSSRLRPDDQAGALLPYWEDEGLEETAPMEVELPIEESPEEGFVPVTFRCHLTELGVLELWCISTRDAQRWKLELNVREEQPASPTA